MLETYSLISLITLLLVTDTVDGDPPIEAPPAVEECLDRPPEQDVCVLQDEEDGTVDEQSNR